MKHYGLKGQEIVEFDNLLEWAEWFETAKRHVADEYVGDVRISTVFLGIDHGFSLDESHAPVLFETMVFGGSLDEYQDRYCTFLEAKNGHDSIVARVKNAQQIWQKKRGIIRKLFDRFFRK